MDPEVRKLFKACLKDEEFIKTLKLADDDPKPTIWMGNNVKVVYASYYYGWLIARHGTNWRNFI